MAKRFAKPARKTASKTALAPPPAHGGAQLPLGAHPGNTGGKKGRSGRKPDALRRMMRGDLTAVLPELRKSFDDPQNKDFDRVRYAEFLARYGVGGAAQELKVDVQAKEPLRIVHEHVVVDREKARGTARLLSDA